MIRARAIHNSTRIILASVAVLTGLILLILVGSAESSIGQPKSLSLPVMCNNCQSQPFQVEASPLDPCGFCHDPVDQHKLLLGDDTKQQIHQLGIEILRFNQSSGGTFKNDPRFQSVLEAYWQAKLAPQDASWLISHAFDLLAILRNEAKSGYWRAIQSARENWVIFTIPDPLTLLPLSPILLLILIYMPIGCLFKAENTTIRLINHRIQHRGPPSEAARMFWSFFLLRRVLSTGMQSPFLLSCDETDCTFVIGVNQGSPMRNFFAERREEISLLCEYLVFWTQTEIFLSGYS